MDSFHYLLLAFVQAATEFLPVSSSGHLLFLKGLLQQKEIPILFDIVVHVGSLLAIVIYYFDKLRMTINNVRFEIVTKGSKKRDLKWVGYLAVSTLVTLVFYIGFKDVIESRYQMPSILAVTYCFTTILLFLTFFKRKKKEGVPLSGKNLFVPLLVGLFQGLAIFPGISRSGSTIAPLLIMGVKKDESAYYSFSLAIPAILGALVFKVIEMRNLPYVNLRWEMVIVALFVSAFFSLLFLRLLVLLIKNEKFWLFSVYTFILAVASFFLFFRGAGS